VAAHIRILHVLDHSIPLHSGYAFRTKAILEHQRALGFETFQLTASRYNLAPSGREDVDGITFYRTARSSELLHKLPVINQLTVVRELRDRLDEVVSETRPDVIHAHSPCLTALAALPVARRRGIPLAYEMRALWEDGAVDHGTDRAGSLRYRASRALETYALRRVNAVTTICEGLRGEIVARGISPDKVTVVRNAVDAERFAREPARDSALVAAHGLDPGPVLGFIGSFYRYEGLAVLLTAVRRLKESFPHLRVLLVGGGPEVAALKAQATELGIDEHVVFTDRVPNDRIQDYYALADLMIYPRLSTRLTELVTPLKPIEAMVLGRPLAASDVGGHRELIRDGVDGVLFVAGDPGALADAVTKLLNDAPKRALLAREARRRALTDMRWEQSVAAYTGVYERLLASRTAAAG
jgi:PEP-CTERM/exosortase A-associated glycosyltransferase